MILRTISAFQDFRVRRYIAHAMMRLRGLLAMHIFVACKLDRCFPIWPDDRGNLLFFFFGIVPVLAHHTDSKGLDEKV